MYCMHKNAFISIRVLNSGAGVLGVTSDGIQGFAGTGLGISVRSANPIFI